MTSATFKSHGFRPACADPSAKGFSLIELLVVMSLIALLTAISFRGLTGHQSGNLLTNVRTEASLFIENARTMAINSGYSRKLKFDSATQTYWVEDVDGNVKTDVRKFESGVQCVSCPASITFTPRGSLEDGNYQTYTFQATNTGKQAQLKIHPQTGRVERL